MVKVTPIQIDALKLKFIRDGKTVAVDTKQKFGGSIERALDIHLNAIAYGLKWSKSLKAGLDEAVRTYLYALCTKGALRTTPEGVWMISNV